MKQSGNKSLLYVVIVLWVCVCLAALGLFAFWISNQPPIQPTFTPTLPPTWTPAPTHTPLPSATLAPTWTPAPTLTLSANCDPAYPGVCIPLSAERISCAALYEMGISDFPVSGSDPYDYDTDSDGIGCETP